MASVNKVILIGNCGKDPEVRYLPSGQAVANVSLATTMKRKDKNSGEMIEDTQWHRVTFFDRVAEIAGEYLRKGSPVYIEGSLKYGRYTDKDGVERYTTDIMANSLQLLGSKGDGGGRQDEGRRDTRPAPARSPGQQARAAQQRPAPAPRGSGGSGFDDMDDDIPF